MNFNFFYSFALDVNMIMFTFKQVGKKNPALLFTQLCHVLHVYEEVIFKCY